MQKMADWGVRLNVIAVQKAQRSQRSGLGIVEIMKTFERNVRHTIETISFALLLGRGKLQGQTVYELYELLAFGWGEEVLQATFQAG